MRYLSLFSGVEAATVAWHPLDWTPVAYAEIEPFPCAVLAHHYPDVPNLGDVTAITEQHIAALGPIDLVVFGSPCQDLSVAGWGKGIDGERSRLFFDAMRIVRWARTRCGARWALWENVPGAFSRNGGRDFARVVGEMVGLDLDIPRGGWRNTGVALGPDGLIEWSVLDAQWFGVPQRRRRIFALADYGDWAGRPPVLFESESLRGDPPPRRETGPSATVGALRSTDGGSDVDHAQGGHLIYGGNNTSGAINVAPACRAKGGSGHGDFESEAFIVFDTTQITSSTNRSRPEPGQPAPCLAKGAHPPAIGFTCKGYGASVRRLTPLECERLQGFPDRYTLVEYRGKPATDSPRYKAIGNSMAIPVMRWIGERIHQVIECSIG